MIPVAKEWINIAQDIKQAASFARERAIVYLTPIQQKRISKKVGRRGIGAYLVLIAATALANQATLVTANLDEFSRVEGLCLEDWTAQ